MSLLEKIFDDFKLKEKIDAISYNGQTYATNLKLNSDVVNNFSVQVKELYPSIMNQLGFPYGVMFKPTDPLKIENEFRIKGKMKNRVIDLEIEVIHPADLRFEGYKPFTGSEEKVKELVRHYHKELSAFVGEKVKEKTIDKALKSWHKSLGLLPEAAEVLKSYVKDNIRQYYTREITVLYVPIIDLLFAKAGQAVFVGGANSHNYTRRMSPIVGLPPFNVLNNLTKSMVNKFSHTPTPIVFENPEQAAIVLPPVVGFFARKHEVRHTLQYAAFHELINPDSLLYKGKSDGVAKHSAYANLAELVKSHFPTCDKLPQSLEMYNYFDGKIVGEYLKGNILSGLLDNIKANDSLSDNYERGIIAGMLFSAAYTRHQRKYEATASSLTGNLMILAAPWAILAAVNPEALVSFAPLVAGLNLLMAFGGYGNLFSYYTARKQILNGKTAEEQLKAITTLGV